MVYQVNFLHFSLGNALFFTLKKENNMNNKDVGKWEQPGLDEQADTLREMFYGKTHFSNIRGQLKGDFLKVAFKSMYDREGVLKSRTQGQKDVRDFFNSFIWVQERIALLERRGMHQAAEEVRKALLYPWYKMIGETDTLENITPVTMVMFEAKTTFAFLTAPINEGYIKTKYLSREIRRKMRYCINEDRFYVRSVFEDLKENYEQYLKKIKVNAPEIWGSKNYIFSFMLLPMKDKKEREEKKKYCFDGIAQIFLASRNEIEQLFTPEECAKTAFWEFSLPAHFIHPEPYHDFNIGLHLAAEHPYWQKMRAPFCSSNISFGRGAVFDPGEAYNCFDEKSEKFRGTRLL
jgi:hypothetical protein